MPKRQRLTATQRRALMILAEAGLNGATTTALLANGFRIVTFSRLVRAGLATLTLQRVRAGDRVLVVATVRITDAGRKSLSD
jgi:hypothetical protein